MKLAPQILDSLPQNIFVLDKELRLVYANKNFLNFFKKQYGGEPAVGKTVMPEVQPEQRSHFELRLREVFTGTCARVEESTDINGVLHYFDVTYQPLEEKGEWTKVVVSFEEITQRKRREIRLMDAEDQLKLQVSSQETLLSVISHDLRSPIFQLNGLLFLIKHATGERDEARLLMHAEDLEERIGHLTHTLDNLLNWSNLQRQNLKPNPTRFQLEDLVTHAVGLLKPVAKLKEVHIEVADISGIELYTDKEMVAFIVRNLVNNAIKFSKESGLVEISVDREGNTVELSVLDHGVGIDPDRIQSLLKGKGTISKPGTWGERGAGLGLALCCEFSQRLNGMIRIFQVEGGGTVVKFSLQV